MLSLENKVPESETPKIPDTKPEGAGRATENTLKGTENTLNVEESMKTGESNKPKDNETKPLPKDENEIRVDNDKLPEVGMNKPEPKPFSRVDEPSLKINKENETKPTIKQPVGSISPEPTAKEEEELSPATTLITEEDLKELGL